MEHLKQSPTFGFYKNLVNEKAQTEFSEMNDSIFEEISKKSLINFGFLSVLRYLEKDIFQNDTLHLKLYYLSEKIGAHKRDIDDFVCSFYAQQKFILNYSECNILHIPLYQPISADSIERQTSIKDLELLLQSQLKADSWIGIYYGIGAYTNACPHRVHSNSWKDLFYDPYMNPEEKVWLKPTIHLEAEVIGNELILTWDIDDKLFFSGITFEWRNLLIHMKVAITDGGKSTRYSFTININGKIYPEFGWVKGFLGGAKIGEAPYIETADHFLKITHGPKKATIKDNLKEGKTSVFEDEIVFKVINIPAILSFKKPEKLENKVTGFKSKIKRNEVTLYDYSEKGVTINSYAYFKEGKLAVDYWKMGGSYEIEYVLFVSYPELDRLYEEFEIPNRNEAELLVVIHNLFNGIECYNSFKDYLTFNKINFEERVDR